ncbi:MAG: GNAT family N-acetyltransferase [Gammaproteobacteria bacterium]|nr:GNAT family N-acetyltransferase [Gammaproteobacteria bacterium]
MKGFAKVTQDMKDSQDNDRIAKTRIHPERTAPAADAQLPPGKLKVVITYLEMSTPPRRTNRSQRAEKIAIIRAERPTTSFYRYLYNTVGAPWLWYERRVLDDSALKQIIHDPQVEIYTLYVGGVPAGYVELDLRHKHEVELAYFGLMPEFIGRGLGKYLMDWSVDMAWSTNPNRVWVHTCNLDHPKAISVYQQAGFVPYRQETLIIDRPEL